MNKKQEIKELKERIAKLEQECNETEFKVGDWVRRDEGVFRIGDKYNDSKYKNSRYCVSPNGNDEFFIDLDGAHNHLYTKATHAEIEQALIAEAKRRGFKKGVKYKTASGRNNSMDKIEGDFTYSRFEEDTLDCGEGAGWIYYKGEWAEIVEEKSLTIAEYDVVDNGLSVKIGCKIIAKIQIKEFLSIYDLAKDNDVILCKETIDILREVVK